MQIDCAHILVPLVPPLNCSLDLRLTAHETLVGHAGAPIELVGWGSSSAWTVRAAIPLRHIYSTEHSSRRTEDAEHLHSHGQPYGSRSDRNRKVSRGEFAH